MKIRWVAVALFHADRQTGKYDGTGYRCPAQAGGQCTYGELCTYTTGNQLKSKPQTHWKLTGRNVTAPPPVLSPSNILPVWKNLAHFQKCYHFKLRYYVTRNLSVCKHIRVKRNKFWTQFHGGSYRRHLLKPVCTFPTHTQTKWR
jgi:hypothetical protein